MRRFHKSDSGIGMKIIEHLVTTLKPFVRISGPVTRYLMLFSVGSLIIGSCTHLPRRDLDLSIIENRVMDSADILTEKEELEIFQLIRSLEVEVGSQVAIVATRTLKGKTVEEYSLEVFERMKLGREKINDGLLITVASDERMVRIEVGYGLERIIRDEIAARIIREDFAPKFRQAKFYEGLHDGVSKIKKLIIGNRQLVGKYP